MATELRPTAAATGTTAVSPVGELYRSIFDVPADFFDACHLISPSATPIPEPSSDASEKNPALVETLIETDPSNEEKSSKSGAGVSRLTCNTCKVEFESLLDQRSHFKSDIHRINVKLSIAGKKIVKEEDFDELTSDSFRDYDISSISGSEDEAERVSFIRNHTQKGAFEGTKQKLFIQLKTGKRVSLWKCLILNESENVSFENEKVVSIDNGEFMGCLREREVIERLNLLIHESRDGSHLRIVLLAGGGHFAGCVFDGNSVVAHKTFHRYVVRAKAGKKQSSKDAGGRAAHSAGASLRRHNELALKKDVQELLAAWKHYFDASSCVFIHAPSSNRQLLFNGDKAYFSHQRCVVRNVPLNVRRPTFKEARRIYNQLTQVAFVVNEKEIPPDTEDDLVSSALTVDGNSSFHDNEKDFSNTFTETAEVSSSHKSDEQCLSSEGEGKAIRATTPLHEAVQSGNADKVMELLEQGFDPCIKDERGRTPYVLANEKEVRNTFRRFMALNIDRWDWQAADVPSALTKEMEESQAAKQAEKDAKRKARAKELKKLRKAKEKKSQETSDQNAAVASSGASSPSAKRPPEPTKRLQISKEEERKTAQATEREKRAAAAERRMAAGAALNTQSSGTNASSSAAQPKGALGNDATCSCCSASLAGKVPFHRYNYKYCSTSCMHVHREILEDE